MAATIGQVAALAGVSTATVSRVLSGAANARQPTRDRVLAAVSSLDYRPSAVARALKRRETRTIGLLVTDIANPFFPLVARAVEAVAAEAGYAIVLANGGNDPAREVEHLELLFERRVDGIVVASARITREHAERLRRAPIPTVVVNAPGAAGLTSVTTAHRRGSRLAAEHLLSLGHRRIGHVAAPRGQGASGLRRQGCDDAVRAGGGTVVVVEGDGGVEGGAAAVDELLRAGVTGIVAYNDLTALGVLRGLRRAGARIPADVSVVGFDDIELASWTDPPLTTVRQPIDGLAAWAVDHLLAAIRLGAADPERAVLEPELVVRGSTGPPPNGS